LTDLHFREEIKSPGDQNTSSDIELNLDTDTYACYCKKRVCAPVNSFILQYNCRKHNVTKTNTVIPS